HALARDAHHRCVRQVPIPLPVFHDPPPAGISTLSLHDALPILVESGGGPGTANIKSHHNVGGLPDDLRFTLVEPLRELFKDEVRDRKSTRLNSSHVKISYAVFCLKKKKPPSALPAVDGSLPAGV